MSVIGVSSHSTARSEPLCTLPDHPGAIAMLLTTDAAAGEPRSAPSVNVIEPCDWPCTQCAAVSTRSSATSVAVQNACPLYDTSAPVAANARVTCPPVMYSSVPTG